MAELVSELAHSGCSLSEIAGMDDRQVIHVLWRRRDRWGRLVLEADQEGMNPEVEIDPDGQRHIRNPVPFGRMFKTLARRAGLGREQTEEVWDRYLDENPKLAALARDGAGE